MTATPDSASRPVLSFTGFLETHLQSLPWDSDQTEQVGSSLSVDQVVRSHHYNPDGKALSDYDKKELATLIRDYRTERAGQLAHEGVLSKAAFVRAVQVGIYKVVEFGPAPSWSDPEAMRAYTSGQQAQSKNLLADMAAKLGKPLVDWAYTSISSAEPDGVPRQTVVYFMFRDAPEVFEARRQLDESQSRRDQVLREFFRRR